MAVDLKKPSTTKDFLQRNNVRTMKKDLAHLREADSLEEKQKIRKIQIDSPKLEVVPQEPIMQAAAPKPKIGLDEVDLAFEKVMNPQKSVAQKPANTSDFYLDKQKIKTLATEAEKQQIFLFQSQKADLEKELMSADRFAGMPFDLQKNKILSERKDMEEKLKKLTDSQLDAISEQQRQDLEKQKWQLESEMKKMDEEVRGVVESSQASEQKLDAIKKEIANIDNSLKTLYAGILVRENVPQKVARPEFTRPQASVPKSKQPEASTPLASLDQKEFLKGVSPVAREKLEVQVKTEEKQRLKFMEDVERWIGISKNNNQQ